MTTHEKVLVLLALTSAAGAAINLRRNRWHHYVDNDFDYEHPAQIGDPEPAQIH